VVDEGLDMPQPLSRVKPDAEINVGAQALTLVPDFVPQIMRVIAVWSDIDGNFANIFSNMLTMDIEVGTAVYQAFNGREARRIALFTAAEKALPEWQQIVLRTVWKATKASQDQRDWFVHHVWGYSRDLPNALLLMDSNVVVDRNVSMKQRTPIEGNRFLITPKDFDRSKVFVYRKPDFDRAVTQAEAASWLVTLSYFSLGTFANEQGRRQLLTEPQFQQAVEPIVRERSPEVQAQLRPPGDDPPAPGIWESWDRSLGRIP
jgi:hypothetical protein